MQFVEKIESSRRRQGQAATVVAMVREWIEANAPAHPSGGELTFQLLVRESGMRFTRDERTGVWPICMALESFRKLILGVRCRGYCHQWTVVVTCDFSSVAFNLFFAEYPGLAQWMLCHDVRLYQPETIEALARGGAGRRRQAEEWQRLINATYSAEARLRTQLAALCGYLAQGQECPESFTYQQVFQAINQLISCRERVIASLLCSLLSWGVFEFETADERFVPTQLFDSYLQAHRQVERQKAQKKLEDELTKAMAGARAAEKKRRELLTQLARARKDAEAARGAVRVARSELRGFKQGNKK